MNETQGRKLPESLIQATVKIWKPGNHGTGFLCPCPFVVDNAFYVVSNEHVLRDFDEKNTHILLSQPTNDCYKSLRPLSNKVYSHPDKNIDLACVIAYQNLCIESVGQFHLEALTPDYFSEPSDPISIDSELIVVGYPISQSSCFYPSNPFEQSTRLVRDIGNVSGESVPHLLAIRPSLEEGSSGSPVFIQRSGRFFVIGVVQGRCKDYGIIIRQHYVVELIDFAAKNLREA